MARPNDPFAVRNGRQAAPAPGAAPGRAPSPSAPKQSNRPGDVAARRLDTLGKNMESWYGERQQRFQDVFRPVDDAFNRMLGNQPTYQRDQYLGARNNRQPTKQSNMYYSYLGQTGPTQNRSYYTNLGTKLGNRTSNSQQRLNDPSRRAPGNVQGRIDDFRNYGRETSVIDQRMQERRAAGPDAFAGYAADRRARVENNPLAITGARKSAESMRASERVDDYLGHLRKGGGESGDFMARITAGGGDSGVVMKDLRAGKTATGQFLNGFDPNSTQGLGETYKAIRGETERPGYTEDFYTSQLAGKNPAYELLKSDMQKDMQRGAAARGGFVSGKSIDMENRGLSRLAADEFSRRGELAQAADATKNQRLGTRLGAASALDEHILGGQRLRADVSGRQDDILGTLATSRDKIGADLSLGRDNLVGTMARAGDENALTKARMVGDLAGREDDILGSRWRDLDSVMGKDADIRGRDAAALDALGVSSAADRERRMRLGFDADSFADTYRRGQEQDLDALGRSADEDWRAGESMLGQAAGRASSEEAGYDEYLGGLARGADSAELGVDQYLGGMAKGASDEQRQYLNDLASTAQDTARAKSAIQQAYDMAAAGTLTSTQMAAIDALLTQAGMNEKSRKALWSMFGTGLGAAGGFLLGGPGGAAAGAKVGYGAGTFMGEATR